MVISPLVTAILAALSCIAIVAIAEWLHAARTHRVAKLAFGATGRPAAWARLVPLIRVTTMGLIAWGLAILFCEPPRVADVQPSPEASKHVLVCLDSSPSMFLEDAGLRQPDNNELQQRMVRGGEVIQAVLDRLDGENTRITVFGVYTKAVPIVEETFDKAVVQNLFDGLPVYTAFAPGPTQLSSTISDAIEYARRWPDGSALLLVVSDGDSTDKTPIRAVPKAIADTLVIGLGQTSQATTIAGHASRQDAESLRALASQLRGTYFDANIRHLPSELLSRLSIIQPRVADGVGLREAAVVAVCFGATLLSILLPTLSLLGAPRRESAAVHSMQSPLAAHSGELV
ncbi:vWA domain-containing protein [Stieleria varia]|uniref:vWA domain-containing protein n=1 Tax=Stieleria varia TaxID=2528005 RepID=UPI0011B61A90|nr:vWA domain-containing protein [Stieleria varia]